MSKVNFSKFYELCDKAEAKNKELGFTRFYVIHTNNRNNRIAAFGVYDYKRKVYTVSDKFSNLNEIFDEMEGIINS